MKYEITVNGKILPVSIEETGRFQYRVMINRKAKFVDAHRTEACVYSILIDGKSYEVDISADGENFIVDIDGERHAVSVIDERRKKLRSIGGQAKISGKQVLTAPMPGRVVRILKERGEKVEKNQGVIVIEAMKMENEIRTNGDGIIKGILVKKGDTVEAGQKLAEIG